MGPETIWLPKFFKISASIEFWLVCSVGLINPSDTWGHWFFHSLSKHFGWSWHCCSLSLISPAGKEGSPRWGRSPWDKGSKGQYFVFTAIYLSFSLACACFCGFTWEMWWGRWRLVSYIVVPFSSSYFYLFLDFINIFSDWTVQESRLTDCIL